MSNENENEVIIIENYGFNEDDVKFIIASVNESEKTFNIENPEDYKLLSEKYLKSAISWLIKHDTLITNNDGSFDEMLRNITCMIAINMFLLLDVTQQGTIINTENSTTIPLNSANVITENIQRLLEPYLQGKSRSGNGPVKIVKPKRRNFGF